jgi:hypothetical protein
MAANQLDLGVGQSALGQPSEHLMPEEVWMDVLFYASQFLVFLDQLLDPARRIGAMLAALE